MKEAAWERDTVLKDSLGEKQSEKQRVQKREQECEPERERERQTVRERDPDSSSVVDSRSGESKSLRDLILSNELFSLARVAGACSAFGDMKVTWWVSSVAFPPCEGAPTHSKISPEAFSSEGPAFCLSYYMFTKWCQS